MAHAVLILVRDHRRQVYILYASENILLDLRIFVRQLFDQFLDLYPFRAHSALTLTGFGRTIVGKFASALNKSEPVVVPPRFDVILSDKVHGTDQRHALEI